MHWYHVPGACIGVVFLCFAALFIWSVLSVMTGPLVATIATVLLMAAWLK